nr:MAG TPA: hypothetical protein [Caudoviricetes sp.]
MKHIYGLALTGTEKMVRHTTLRILWRTWKLPLKWCINFTMLSEMSTTHKQWKTPAKCLVTWLVHKPIKPNIMTYVVNNSECGDKNFKVYLWTGAGYNVAMFEVFAFDEEHALECVLAYCEEKALCGLYCTDEDLNDLSDEERDELYYYIDPTREDKKAFPAYVLLENLMIEKVA